jgi:hypothetical protein
MAALLLAAGWEGCYHREGPRFHYNVKLDGNGRWTGIRSAVREIENGRGDVFDAQLLERYVEADAESQLEMWWEDVAYDLAEYASTDRPKVWSCGRSGGYVNVPEWERPWSVPSLIRAAAYFGWQREACNTEEAGRALVKYALERYDFDKLEELASPRAERVEA